MPRPRADVLAERSYRVRQFIQDVTDEAAKLQTQNLTLVALAFVFGLLLEALEKIGSASGQQQAELTGVRHKWQSRPEDK